MLFVRFSVYAIVSCGTRLTLFCYLLLTLHVFLMFTVCNLGCEGQSQAVTHGNSGVTLVTHSRHTWVLCHGTTLRMSQIAFHFV